jgi:hypothetical protein
MARKPKSADTTSNTLKSSKYPPERLAGLRPVQPGQVLNPAGRPKGSRNKLGEDFIAAMQADFAEHGAATIKQVREEKPADYIKVVAGILPKELNVRTEALEEIAEDELAAAIVILRSAIAAQQAGGGADPETKH